MLIFKIDSKGKEVIDAEATEKFNATYRETEKPSMPKKGKADPEDDLELEEDEETEEETEEEEDEEDNEESDEEEDDSEGEEEEDEDAEEESEDVEEDGPKKSRGRPKGSKNKPEPEGKKSVGIVLLKSGVPKKVSILKVMGKNVKVTKPGKHDFPPVRVPITDVRLYSKEAYEALEELSTKIQALRDKQLGIFAKLGNLTARKGVAKKTNLLEEL